MNSRNLRPVASESFVEPPASGEVEAATGFACERCYGSGFEVIPGRGARRCSCRDSGSHAHAPDRTRIPELFRACTLASYRPTPGNTSQLRALTFARQLVAEYPRERRGLLLMGAVGTGKTHLAAGVLRGLAEKGTGCLFLNAGRLLKEVQAAYDPSSSVTEAQALAPALTSEVLVLDEIGATKPTEWARDTLLYVINTRYEERRTTLFTTNHLDAPTASGEETLEERIGVRSRSRLRQMCRTAIIDGDDFRSTHDLL